MKLKRLLLSITMLLTINSGTVNTINASTEPSYSHKTILTDVMTQEEQRRTQAQGMSFAIGGFEGLKELFLYYQTQQGDAAARKASHSITSLVFNWENALQTGLSTGITLALSASLPIIGVTLTSYFLNVLFAQKPEIVEQEAYPKYGRFDRLKRWWGQYKTPDVIFDEQVKDQLLEIEQKTKNTCEKILKGNKQATYTNLLLHGPAGTGKTIFARVLGDYTNMDFLPIPGARLLQSPLAFSQIIRMANHSKYGTIIFIDEADDLFLSRDIIMASKSPEALSRLTTLNYILGLIGTKSNKYMIIAATNNPHILDEAMDRRFPDTIEMPLPSLPTRIALLTLYINNLFFNKKTNSKEFIAAASVLLTPDFIEDLAETTAGFSHAKLEDLIKAMYDTTGTTTGGTLTQTTINNAINRSIKKLRDLEKFKEKRTNLFGKPA